jgi:hypothetical protein
MADLAKEIEDVAEDLKATIRASSEDDLREKLYIVLANGALLLLSYMKEEGKPNWSQKLVNEVGEPMLSSEEQAFLERKFSEAPWILEALKEPFDGDVQKGGGLPDLKARGTALTSSTLPLPEIDFSLDEMFKKLLNKSQEMDDFWGRVAYETPGALRMMNRDVQVPVPGLGPVPVSVKAISFFLTTFIDSIRFTSGVAGQSATGLTLLMIVQEALTGQWRQMILSAAGLISPTGMAMGIVFKYVVNAWMLIAPDLRGEILRDAYRGGKSVFIGFLLWAFNTFPPNVVKLPIAAALKRITDGVQNIEGQLQSLENSASKALEPVGKRVKFRGIDLSTLSKISLDDIQNFQALARWNLLICTDEFSTIVEEVKKEPILRFLMELIGVPTLAEDKFKVCQQSEPYPSVAEKMMKAMDVSIEDDPDAKSLIPEGLPAIPQGLPTGLPGGLPAIPQGPQGLPKGLPQGLPKGLPKVGGHRKTRRKRSTSQSARRLTRARKSRTP